MFQSLHTIKTSMIQNQRNVDVISNNIANVNNDGFKKNDYSFSEILYETFDKKYLDNDSTSYQVGHGVSGSEEKSFREGTLVTTENNLDIAVNGEGFFLVSAQDNQSYLTRGGSFTTEEILGQKYITTKDGRFLLDQNENPITFTGSEQTLSITGDGQVFNETGAQIARLALVGVENKETLEVVGDNYYSANEQTVYMNQGELGQICQNTKEKSNVDLSEEMTSLIKAQRMYQISSRIIQAVDEMHSQANHLRR